MAKRNETDREGNRITTHKRPFDLFTIQRMHRSHFILRPFTSSKSVNDDERKQWVKQDDNKRWFEMYKNQANGERRTKTKIFSRSFVAIYFSLRFSHSNSEFHLLLLRANAKHFFSILFVLSYLKFRCSFVWGSEEFKNVMGKCESSISQFPVFRFLWIRFVGQLWKIRWIESNQFVRWSHGKRQNRIHWFFDVEKVVDASLSKKSLVRSC